MKSIAFDPTDDEILYSGALDDFIRKWAINNCTELAEIDVSESISSVAVSPNGTDIIYGCLYGKVGKVNSGFSSFTTSTAHQFTVLNIIYMNADYYVTIG